MKKEAILAGELVWGTSARPFELDFEFTKNIAKRCTASVRGEGSKIHKV